jgi:hypothetical protein
MDFARLAKPWLLMLFQVIRATSPALEMARGRCDLSGDAGRALWSYFHEKWDDEDMHDVLLLDDLKSIGVNPEASVPNPFVAEMVGRQFYLIEFSHPAAYLGYIGLLEGFPPTLGQIDELERVSGLPSSAFRTARLHARVDVEHRRALSEILDRTPEHLRPPILANALRCAALQSGALAHLAYQENPTWTP